MADVAESSSMPSKNEKPVIVRVKRKAFQSPVEAFWLEINERPVKRPLLGFEQLSISESSRKVEELKTKKVLVRHMDTVSSSEVTIDTLRSFVPNSADTSECKAKNKERRHTFKTECKQDQLLVKAKQQQEHLSKIARFEQIWRSRKGKKAMHDETIHEMCHLYDVVRVDVEETTNAVQEQDKAELEDHRIMCSYLPLLREFIPSAAAEVESDINAYMYKQASKDDYVYDFYAVEKGISITEQDTSNPFPLVQVDDGDGFYYGPVESEFESDDSNAEENPMNDYPDEETSEDKEETESGTSNDESEELDSATANDKSPEHKELVQQDWSEDSQSLYEDEIYSGGGDGDDGDAYYYEGGYDDDWR